MQTFCFFINYIPLFIIHLLMQTYNLMRKKTTSLKLVCVFGIAYFGEIKINRI